MIKKLEVGVLSRDNGDGSSSCQVFPSYEDARSEWMAMNDWDSEDDIPEETCFYDNGSVERMTIELNVDKKGKITLAKSFYMQAGDQ